MAKTLQDPQIEIDGTQRNIDFKRRLIDRWKDHIENPDRPLPVDLYEQWITMETAEIEAMEARIREIRWESHR